MEVSVRVHAYIWGGQMARLAVEETTNQTYARNLVAIKGTLRIRANYEMGLLEEALYSLFYGPSARTALFIGFLLERTSAPPPKKGTEFQTDSDEYLGRAEWIGRWRYNGNCPKYPLFISGHELTESSFQSCNQFAPRIPLAFPNSCICGQDLITCECQFISANSCTTPLLHY